MSDQARIYARTLHTFRPHGKLTVWRKVCNANGVCAAGPRTKHLRDDLTQLLGSRLRYSAHRVGSIGLLHVHVTARKANAHVQERCGKFCAEGMRAYFRKLDTGRWKLTDAYHYIT